MNTPGFVVHLYAQGSHGSGLRPMIRIPVTRFFINGEVAGAIGMIQEQVLCACRNRTVWLPDDGNPEVDSVNSLQSRVFGKFARAGRPFFAAGRSPELPRNDHRVDGRLPQIPFQGNSTSAPKSPLSV